MPGLAITKTIKNAQLIDSDVTELIKLRICRMRISTYKFVQMRICRPVIKFT